MLWIKRALNLVLFLIIGAVLWLGGMVIIGLFTGCAPLPSGTASENKKRCYVIYESFAKHKAEKKRICER